MELASQEQRELCTSLSDKTNLKLGLFQDFIT